MNLFIFYSWLCVRFEFVFLLFLFKIYLNRNLCDFWFLILFLVKINKLIFFI